jgi:hypothetical protein
MPKDPNHDAQVAAAKSVAAQFSTATSDGQAKELAKRLKDLLDAIVWDS